MKVVEGHLDSRWFPCCWREGEAADRGLAWRTGSSEDGPMAERGGQLAAKLANRKNAKYGEKII